MRSYINTSSTIIFEAKIFKPCYLAIVFHSICFVVVDTNIGAEFRVPMGITFHHRFPSGTKNASIYRASSSATTCQYPLSISTAIK